jgi:hypothetical protein
MNETQMLKTGVQLASEYVIPGGSNLIKGDFVNGGIHAMLGLAAKAMFGLPGMLLVCASSFAKASTGQNLLEAIGSPSTTTPPTPPAPPAPTPASHKNP